MVNWNDLGPKARALLKDQGVNRDSYNIAINGITETTRIAIERLQKLPDIYFDGLYIGTSGGKDSVTIAWLMDMAFPNNRFILVHTPKPGVTHEKTLQFLYRLSAQRTVMFVPSNEHANYRSSIFKTQIDGTRTVEHGRTNGRSTDVVIDGVPVSRDKMTFSTENGLFGLRFVFPIYDWTDADVWALIFSQGIEFTEEYYL